jgi:uncharacterized protein (DUF305 family)
MSRFTLRKTFLRALTLTAAAALAAGCADSSDESREAKEAEQAFLAAMAPHHESAIAMAVVASKRARHAELRELTGAIVSTQEAEIGRMARIHRHLTGETLRPNMDAHQQLGLSAEQAGMMHDGREAVAELNGAKPFDRAFIDAMVPHHQGAIRMARAVLAVTEDAELRRLAERIVANQSREIAQMNRWRSAWYGGPSPAGGVPKSGSGGADRMNGSEREPGGAHERHDGPSPAAGVPRSGSGGAQLKNRSEREPGGAHERR